MPMPKKPKFFRKSFSPQSGLTLVELLIGAVIAALVATAVLGFFIKQSSQYAAQGEISNLQQNVRASLEEIVSNLRYAGAAMPPGLQPIIARNADPDTIYVGYNETGCFVEVGQNTSGSSASPIRMTKSSDLSCFSVGQRICFYHKATRQAEWFNVTGLDTNGLTWNEISHSSNNLSADPQAGDTVLALKVVKYWIDRSNAQHPILKRKVDTGADEIFAEDVEDLQFTYVLSTGAGTSAPAATDFVRSVVVTVAGKTQKKDLDYKDNSGYRQRSLSTVVHLRNSL